MATHVVRLKAAADAVAGAPVGVDLLQKLAAAAGADQRQAVLDAGFNPDALTQEQQAGAVLRWLQRQVRELLRRHDPQVATAAAALNNAVLASEAALAAAIPPAEL